jgi:VIT1/CCC1 family predicted Fe2+/Mn2+ transporter
MPDEDLKERVDRELLELLNELRVALPGVQVLFAFLLILPFSQGFSEVTTGQRAVYLGSLVATALATALLIAPSTYHRIHFRAGEKERMLFSANRMSIVGTVFLAIAIFLVVFLITDVVYDLLPASIVSGVVAGFFVWFWYGLPVLRLLSDKPKSKV